MQNLPADGREPVRFDPPRATMARMDAETTGELQALRRRAYAPDADIHDDPTAAARLAELEELHRPATPPAAGPAAPPGSSGEPGAAPPVESEAEAEPSAGPWLPPRIPALAKAAWAVSVVAAAALAASVTWGLASIPPVSTSTGAVQVATLEPTDDVPLASNFFGGPGSSTVFEYLGYAVVHADQSGYGTDGYCLSVFAIDKIVDEGRGLEGPVYYGCSSGPFPARTALTINTESPDAAQGKFFEGTALEFVMSGDNRVGVFAAPPPTENAAGTGQGN